MSLFSKEKEADKKDKEPSSAKKKEFVLQTRNSKIAYDVLIEPWVTEKSHTMMESGKYVFKVVSGATKTDVKKAIEGIYGVNVEKMAVVSVSPKTKYFGRRKGVKGGFKKAIVTLKKGESIGLFQGA